MKQLGLLGLFIGWTLSVSLVFSQDNSPPPGEYGVLIVTVNGFESTDGQARVYLFNSAEGFPSHPEKALDVRKEKLTGPELTLSYSNLPYGRYAIAAHHDVNGNDRLDHNWIYMPREPYGASNGARSRFSAPNFNKARFDLNADTVRVTVTVK